MTHKNFFILLLPLFVAGCASTARYGFSWHKFPADGHRTGVTAVTADNATEALGISNGEFYTAPNGKIFVGGATPEVAELLYDVQDEIKELKTVVGHSINGMSSYRPESPLSDWTADVLLERAGELSGEHIDVSITNFGGIRCNIPQGDVLKDDLVSMFPFKNYLCIVTLKGSRLREIYSQLASEKMEAVGGCTLTVRNGQLESVHIGGKPLDDDGTYKLATIDFLLHGGDRHNYGENVDSVLVTDYLMIDVILPKVLELTSEGKTIDYSTDGRVVYINGDEK